MWILIILGLKVQNASLWILDRLKLFTDGKECQNVMSLWEPGIDVFTFSFPFVQLLSSCLCDNTHIPDCFNFFYFLFFVSERTGLNGGIYVSMETYKHGVT
jgi:hypothetical protein